MGTLLVMYGRIISIMQDLRRPPALRARADICIQLAMYYIDDLVAESYVRTVSWSLYYDNDLYIRYAYILFFYFFCLSCFFQQAFWLCEFLFTRKLFF